MSPHYVLSMLNLTGHFPIHIRSCDNAGVECTEEGGSTKVY